MKFVQLRAIEKEDLDFLYQIENDRQYWNYSNRLEYYSKTLLKTFLEIQQQDIYKTRQKRFVITSDENTKCGFVDLFEFEPKHQRASVGIILKEEFRLKGIGYRALSLLEEYAEDTLNLHQVYANIASENIASIKLFEKSNYKRISIKKDWNFYNNKFHDELLYQKLFLVTKP
ncbi:MAG: GNAT family protein [Flavobacteriaceae bacterium]|nr:GNAT family protein [Flavobacteriaceae bacterium]MCY4215973.1 GNAT family protein [Flavobacteriaceae bacterium]MCY4253241.1 GNAT family protein [Flavobacteriaceae bacterium]